MKGENCNSCIMKRVGGTGWVVEDGELKHGVLIVLEAPGEEEVKGGKPLQGKSGKWVDKLISSIPDPETGETLKREDFLITNILRCRPPGNELTGKPWEKAAISTCKPYLEAYLERVKPRAILACGNQAFRWFTGHWGIEANNLRGYVFPTRWGPVIPTYHPSYIIRGKFHLGRIWAMDLKKALFIARGGELKKEKHYLLDPSFKEMEKWVEEYEGRLREDPSTTLAFDIETPYKGEEKDEELGDVEWTMVDNSPIESDASYIILRCSLSFSPFKAISFPWVKPFSDLAKRALSSTGPKTVWNGNFDIPRLRYNGAEIGGRIYDSMFAWHFWEPVLPMGLKYAATLLTPDMEAWHLESGKNPAYYSAADSDVLLRCFLEIKKALMESGRWERFERHVVDLEKVLSKMSRRGILVDREKRERFAKEFGEKYEEVVKTLQPLIPLSLLPKKVFKLSEERLRRSGSWEEGRMMKVRVLEEEKPPKEKKEKVAAPGVKRGRKKSSSKSSSPTEDLKEELMSPSVGDVLKG